MKTSIRVVSCTLLAMSLVGCAGSMNNEDAGAITGGIVGGLLGNTIGKGSGRVAATVGGAMVGTYIGSNIGRSMDESDRREVSRALESTRTNETYSWRNPDTGYRYRVKPVETYRHESRPCRKYVTEAWIDGERKQVHGKACRRNDGTWHIAN